MSNDGFAVPKDKQNVTVHLDATVSIEGSIFLEAAPAHIPYITR